MLKRTIPLESVSRSDDATSVLSSKPNGTRPAGGRRMPAGAKALIQSIGQSGHKTGWLRERFTGQSAVKQEKDPLALWGGRLGAFRPRSRHE